MNSNLSLFLLGCLLVGVSLGAGEPGIITNSARLSNSGSEAIALDRAACTAQLFAVSNSTNCINYFSPQGTILNSTCPQESPHLVGASCVSGFCFSLSHGNDSNPATSIYSFSTSVPATSFATGLFDEPIMLTANPLSASVVSILVVDGLANSSIWLISWTRPSGPAGPPSLIIPNLGNTQPVAGISFLTATTFIISYQQATRAYVYGTAGDFVGNVGTFGNVQTISADFYGRVFVYDLGCACVKILDPSTSLTWVKTIMVAANGLVNPRQVIQARDYIFVLDDLGITRFYDTFVLVTYTAANDSCLTRGGSISANVSGGASPYTYTVLPDKTTATVNATGYRYTLYPKNVTLTAPYYIFNDIMSAEFSDAYSGTLGRKGIMNSTFFSTTNTYGMQMVSRVRYGWKAGGTITINATNWEFIQLMVNFANGGQTFSIDLGSTAYPTYYYNASDYALNSWVQITLDLKVGTAASYGFLYITDTSNYNANGNLDVNMMYVDSVFLIPYTNNLRTMRIVDFCGAAVSTNNFEIMYTDTKMRFVTRPSTCASGGVDGSKASDGQVAVYPSGGVGNYTYSWSFTSNTNFNQTGLAGAPNKDIVYENIINSPFAFSGSVTGMNLSDTSYYHSAPYSFSFTPTTSEAWKINSPYLYDATQYSAVEFWINGGALGQQIVYIKLLRNGASIGTQYHIHKLTGLVALPPNMWIKVQYPILASLGTFTGISFTASGNWAQPRMYIDDIILIRSTRQVNVSDSTACYAASSDFVIPSPKLVTVTPTVTNVKCYGQSSGQVVLNVAGGAPPYIYSWENTTGNTVTGMPYSSFEVAVRDQNGCLGAVANTTINVLQPPPLQLFYNVVEPKCYGELGRVSATVYGGMSPFIYRWTSVNASIAAPNMLPQLTPIHIFEDSFANGFSMVILTQTDGLLLRQKKRQVHKVAELVKPAVVCRGVGAALSVSSPVHTGYCAIEMAQGASVGEFFSLGCTQCVDLTTYASIQFWVNFEDPADARHLYLQLYQQNVSVSAAVPLFDSPSLATIQTGWRMVTMNLSISFEEIVDYIMFGTSSATAGRILFDDIVFIPVSSYTFSNGYKVRTGFQSVIYAGAEQYVVSVTDLHSCPISETITITQPPDFEIAYVVDNPTSSNVTDGAIQVFVAGATPPYSFLWTESGETTCNVSNIGKGTHEVLVTDANGCGQTVTIFVEPYYDDSLTVRIFDSKISYGMGALVGIGGLIWIFAVIMLVKYWDSFSRHGSFFSAVLVTGVAIALTSAIVLLPQPTDALCIAFPWLLGIAFTLVYGCLFIKTWALYQVWRKASQYQKAKLTPFYIVKVLSVAVSLEVIFLIIWTVVDPPRASYQKMVGRQLELQCSSAAPTFWVIFVAIKGLWLIIGAILSVLTRDLIKEYNESASIAYAIYNNVLLGVIAVPLAVLLGKISGGRIVIIVAIVVVAFTFTTVILFFNVWHRVLFSKEDIIDKAMRSKSTNSRSSKSHSISRDNSPSHSAKQSDTTPPPTPPMSRATSTSINVHLV